jgi:hypothetical protein
MKKVIGLSIVMLYVFSCFGTMPKQCFTPRFAVECQRVQLTAISEWRSVTWDAVHSVRTF